jgi:hypothetical protein
MNPGGWATPHMCITLPLDWLQRLLTADCRPRASGAAAGAGQPHQPPQWVPLVRSVARGSTSGVGVDSGNAEVDVAVGALLSDGGTRTYFGSTFAAWQVGGCVGSVVAWGLG